MTKLLVNTYQGQKSHLRLVGLSGGNWSAVLIIHKTVSNTDNTTCLYKAIKVNNKKNACKDVLLVKTVDNWNYFFT